MRAIIQRVGSASVTIDGETVGSIGAGYMILLGVSQQDTDEQAAKLWSKISKLRIFCDEAGKTNLSIHDIAGSVLIVSQFTLYADCKKGNRPSFLKAGDPTFANEMYEYVISKCKTYEGLKVERGKFGADMKVELINDGPFTIVLDSEEM